MNLLDLHQRTVRNVFLNVEILLNDKVDDLSEYDIQGLMFNYLHRALLNTAASTSRERNGKVDCVVYDSGEVALLYEIKTYYKRHEKLLQSHLDHDIEKLRNRLVEHKNARAYLLLAGRKANFSVDSLRKFPWLSDRIHGKRFSWVRYPLDDGISVKLRPSQLQQYGRGVAVTWEVKL